MFFGQLKVVLIISSVSVFLAACGSGGSGGSADPVASSPAANTTSTGGSGSSSTAVFSLSSRSPTANAINRSLLTSIDLVFDRVLMATTVTSSAMYVEQAGTRQDITLTHTDGSAQVRIGFANPLSPNTTYTVVIGNALMAQDGSRYVAEQWEFATAAEIGATSQAVIDQCMSQQDIAMLAAVNQARAVARSCGSTASPAVAALAWNCKLEQAANGHSQDMAENDFFDHTGSNGLSSGNRVTNAGYTWNGVSENIAAGQTTLSQVITGWLNSPGHCSNIMAAWPTELGAARVSSATATYSNYWTQNFARPL